MKRITIQDIADELHLSRNTVAKALSDGNVSVETRTEVVQKAYQMGYSKLDEKLLEEVQESVKKKNSGSILVLFDRSESNFWTQMLTGISDAAAELGYRMQLHVVDEKDEDGTETFSVIDSDVRGVIFLCVFPIRFVKGISKAGLPMAFFDIPVNAQEYIELGDVINVEGFYAITKTTNYLLQKGIKTFSFIGYAEGSRVVQARYLGFLNALHQAGMEPDEQMLFTRPSNGEYYYYGLVEEIIMNMREVPEAIVCENDDIAEYVATALLKRNHELVSRTYITGFDHTIKPDFFKSDIITVEIRKEKLGKRLVKSILDRVEDPEMDHAFITLSTYPVLK